MAHRKPAADRGRLPFSGLRRMKRTLLFLFVAVPACASAAWRIDCHIDFEGEGRVVVSRPVASPYAVASIAVGDIFLFRSDTCGLKVRPGLSPLPSR